MAKVADVKLSWKKSPSSDVAGIKVTVNNGGTETVVDGGPTTEELMIVVNASTTVSFKVDTTDAEGNTATSATYTFTLGDLEAPLPATELKHTVVAVRDV